MSASDGRSPEAVARRRETARVRSARRYAEKAEAIQAERRQRYAELRDAVLLKYGGRCVECGDDRLLALDLDHVNGGGSKEYRAMHRLTYYTRLLAEPIREDLQVMCGSCHNIKSRGG